MTKELRYKLDNNLKLTAKELEELKSLMLKDELERKKELNKLKEEKEKLEKLKEEEEIKKEEEKEKLEKSYEQKIIDGDIPLPKEKKIVNGVLEDKTPKELFKDNVWSKEEYSDYQRNVRNNFLLMTDRCMLSDYPIEKKQKDLIIEYRQMLRDLPQKKEFPDVEIMTPEEFEAQKNAVSAEATKGGKK